MESSEGRLLVGQSSYGGDLSPENGASPHLNRPVCERILTQRCAETSDLLVSGVVMPVVRVNPHKVGCGLCRMD